MTAPRWEEAPVALLSLNNSINGQGRVEAVACRPGAGELSAGKVLSSPVGGLRTTTRTTYRQRERKWFNCYFSKLSCLQPVRLIP